MKWEGIGHCLSSKRIIGEITQLEEIDYGKSNSIVLVADSVTPSELFSIKHVDKIKAIVLKHGSLGDHSAGLLNGLGIQLCISEELPVVRSGLNILIDGEQERIYINELESLMKIYNNAFEKHSTYDSNNYESLTQPLAYLDEPISILVDGKNSIELIEGIKNDADGIGILRTDWINWDRPKFADIKTHYRIYKECAENVSPKKLNIRLFDLGGDKVPLWATLFKEQMQSPLGYRGIRAINLLDNAFKNQLNAIFKLSGELDLGLLIPMVTDINEIDLILELVPQNVADKISIGAMIEVPSAATEIKQIIEQVDFIRIGPGDLTQFCLAKMRSNLSPLEFSGSSFHPAVIELIKNVARECKYYKKDLSICLDIEPRIPLLKSLLQAGIRTFSASPANIQVTRQRIKSIINDM